MSPTKLKTRKRIVALRDNDDAETDEVPSATDVLDEEEIDEVINRALAEDEQQFLSRLPEDERARSADERAKAARVICSFRGDANLTLTYLRTSPNPYREDDADTIEIYADDRGFEYWIDPQGDVLVQAGPSARVHPTPRKTAPEARRSVSELRAAAVALICSQLPDFADKRSNYHPLEDNRHRETYFFRWDDFSQPAKESELPPFVQVGLHADGTLASYTNTLRR